jgi:hypothetical protein
MGWKGYMTRPSGNQFNQFFARVDHIRSLRGAGVAYVGDRASTLMRRSAHSSGLQTYVVLSEEDSRAPIILAQGTTPPPNVAAELIGLGINCGSAVLAWSVVTSSAASVPLTGGASGVITTLAWGATVASSAQCANSLLRSIDVTVHHAAWLTYLDSQEWYNWVGKLLDWLSLAGAGLSAISSVRAVAAVRAVSNRSWKEVLQGLNRVERKRLTTELIRMQHKSASGAKVKELIRAGQFPARFAADEITAALFKQLRDAVSATLSFVGSATSGNIKALYVSVYQE